MVGRLIHYGPKPIEPPIRANGSGIYKPRGFWFSVEGPDDWESWCRGEQWGLENLACAHEVLLDSHANILHVEGDESLVAFDREWGVDWRIGASSYSRRVILWSEVAQSYQGVIIAPYLWEHRLGAMDWYYPWDCASGCIWDVEAIASVRLLTDAERPIIEMEAVE